MATEFERELLELKRRAEEQAVAEERERQARYREAQNALHQQQIDRARQEEERLREISRLVEPFMQDVGDLMLGIGSATFGKGKYGYDFALGDGKVIQKSVLARPVVELGESIARWRVGIVRQRYVYNRNPHNIPDRITRDLNFVRDHLIERNKRDGYEAGTKELFEVHLVCSPEGNLSFVNMQYQEHSDRIYSAIEAPSIDSLRQVLAESFLRGPNVISVNVINLPYERPDIRMG